MLTHTRLLDVLHYDRNTGIFTWKIQKAQRTKAGQRAGTLCNRDGYESISIDNKIYKSHRLAWLYETGSFPESFIDHINRIRTDNRFCNLRLADKKQNMENLPIRIDSRSGYRGVSYMKLKNQWRAYVSHNKKQFHLGYFDSKEEAAKVAHEKRKELFTHYESNV